MKTVFKSNTGQQTKSGPFKTVKSKRDGRDKFLDILHGTLIY